MGQVGFFDSTICLLPILRIKYIFKNDQPESSERHSSENGKGNSNLGAKTIVSANKYGDHNTDERCNIRSFSEHP
jgi:hypothetical protein